MKNSSIIAIMCSALYLMSCAPHKPAPIFERPAPPSIKISDHIVSSGETLFSIAWQYEIDYKKLAAVNKLSAAYTIYPGQRLTLDLSGYRAVPPVRVASVPKKGLSVAKKEPSAAKKGPSKTKQAAVEKQVVVSKVVAKPSVSSTAVKVSKLPKAWQWTWPVSGKVVKKYDSSSLLKGIYIYSKKGAAVKAAAPGVVVYTGKDLRGYGNLIILKHSKVFLSAYAHNRNMFAKEGERVSAGEKIADIGGDANRFYFEIRKDGNSVDPMRYLPKKQ